MKKLSLAIPLLGLFTAVSVSSYAADYVELDPKKYDEWKMVAKNTKAHNLYFGDTKRGRKPEISLMFYFDPICEDVECDETQDTVRDWVQANVDAKKLGGTTGNGKKTAKYVRFPYFARFKENYESVFNDQMFFDGGDKRQEQFKSFDLLARLYYDYKSMCGLGQYIKEENTACGNLLRDSITDFGLGNTEPAYSYSQGLEYAKSKLNLKSKRHAAYQLVMHDESGFINWSSPNDFGGRVAIQWWDNIGTNANGYPVLVANTTVENDRGTTEKAILYTEGKSSAEITAWLDANYIK